MEPVNQAAAHLSPAAQKFLEYVTSDPERTRRLDHLGDNCPKWLYTFYQHCQFQSWPTFVGAEKLAELRRATVGLTRLIESIPARIFGNDPGQIAAHYHIPEYVVRLLLEPPTGLDSALARADLFDTADGFKCLEVNAGRIGGWLFGYLEEHVRAHPMIARFLAEERIEPHHRDALEAMLRHVLTHNLGKRTAASGALNIAIVVDEANLARDDARLSRIYRELLAASGSGLTGSVVLCPYSVLTVSQNQVWYQDDQRPIHAIVEMSAENPPPGVFRCFKAGRVSLYNGPANPLINTKGNLAVLSEHADSAVFTAEERDILRRHLPWTRFLSPGVATYRGATGPLPELLLAHREELVLKPVLGYQGQGVSLGRLTPPDTWAKLVRDAVAQGGWLAQERVDSRPYLYQCGERGYGVHDVVWGAFCFSESYGGGFLRMMLHGTGDGVINSARGASEGILFEV